MELLIALVAVMVMAAIFSGVSLFLGLFWPAFKTSGKGGLQTLYVRFLPIAALYILLFFLGIGGLPNLLIMTLAYKTLFHAGWVQALVIGMLGGLIGLAVLFLILAPLVNT